MRQSSEQQVLRCQQQAARELAELEQKKTELEQQMTQALKEAQASSSGNGVLGARNQIFLCGVAKNEQ